MRPYSEPRRIMVELYVMLIAGLLLVIGIPALYNCAYAGTDRPMFRKQPIGNGSSGDDEPDTPGCVSITASKRCVNGRSCVDDLEMYSCCVLDTGPCETLINGVIYGVLVRSVSPPLLPGDFITAIEDTSILESESDVSLVTYLRMQPRVRVLRIAVDHLGNRYTTSVEVEAPAKFLFQRGTWTPGVGVVAVDDE